MHASLFFLVKFFPVWSISLFIILLPLAYNLFRLKKYLSSVVILFIVFVLSVALYFYIVNDGYNNAVGFVMKLINN